MGRSTSTDLGAVAAMTVTPLNGRTAVVTSGDSWWTRDNDNMSVWDLSARERLGQCSPTTSRGQPDHERHEIQTGQVRGEQLGQGGVGLGDEPAGSLTGRRDGYITPGTP